MPQTRSLTLPLPVADLPARKPTRFEIVPDEPDMAVLAAELGLIALRKLRFKGELRPRGKRDWELEAALGATVVQPCIVTLDPVTTRIEETVVRRYVAGLTPPTGEEVEMPEDDTEEPLPEVIDPGAVMAEALALALPLYPRAEGAAGEIQAGPPGAEPLTEAAMRPFAGLDKLLGAKDKSGDAGG